MADMGMVLEHDEIVYRVSAQRLARQREARVTVPVELLASAEGSDLPQARERVQATLKNLLDTEWVLSRFEREGEAAGYEQLSVTALARVPVDQTGGLAERARRASVQGVSLGTPTVDYRVPPSVIARMAHELRKEIIGQVQEQLADFSLWTGRNWRIGRVTFGQGSSTGQRTSKGVYRSDGDLDDDAVPEAATVNVGGAERVQLVAEVVLRADAAGRPDVP